jgi:hypothetical protein
MEVTFAGSFAVRLVHPVRARPVIACEIVAAGEAVR